MKQRNLISDDAINWQLWRLKTSNQWTIGKLIDNYYIITNWKFVHILDYFHFFQA
jgi:hypothetical protein